MSGFAADGESSKKKQRVAAAAPTPNKDRFFQGLEAVVTARGGEGQLMVAGIPRDDDEEDEDDEDDDGKDYTEEQFAAMRFIVITKNRAKLLEKAFKFADPNDGFFTTSSGNKIISGLPAQIAKALKPTDLSARFDGLLALTHAIHTYDDWMHDNEYWGEGGKLDGVVKTLAGAWKKLLKNTNDALDIDPEFTRPGIERLLADFADKCDTTESIEVEFEWQ